MERMEKKGTRHIYLRQRRKRIICFIFLIFVIFHANSQCIGFDSIICKHVGRHTKRYGLPKKNFNYTLCLKQGFKIKPITSCVDGYVINFYFAKYNADGARVTTYLHLQPYQYYILDHKIADVNSLFSKIIPTIYYVDDPREKAYGKEYLNNFKMLHVKGMIVNGKLEGTWSYFDVEGNLLATIEFKDGKKNGLFNMYFLDGSLFRSTNYVNDVINGDDIVYNQKGKIVEHEFWFENGDVEVIKKYKCWDCE